MDGNFNIGSVKRQPLPAREILTAQQVINWVAFGAAADVDMGGRAEFVRFWGAKPAEPYDTCPLLIALEEIETGVLYQGTPGRKREVAAARTRAEELIRLWRSDPQSMAKSVQSHLADFWEKQGRVYQAVAVIVDAIAGGKISVIARAVGTNSGPAAQLSADLLTTNGVWIGGDGGISIQGCLEYRGAKFRTAEITKYWLEAAGAVPRRPRKPSGNNFTENDAPILAEMKQMIESGNARTVEDAARIMVDTRDVAGIGSADSRAKRLMRACNRLNSR